jgi:long-subunit acyl-CoA synthetase (AMP-forming)
VQIAEGGLLTRALVSAALSVSERRREVLSSGRQPSRFLEMQYALADKTIIRKLRAPLGGMLQISPVGKWRKAQAGGGRGGGSDTACMVVILNAYDLIVGHVCAGGSAMNVEVARFFENIGVAISESLHHFIS